MGGEGGREGLNDGEREWRSEAKPFIADSLDATYPNTTPPIGVGDIRIMWSRYIMC